jgi:hypothetical protein
MNDLGAGVRFPADAEFSFSVSAGSIPALGPCRPLLNGNRVAVFPRINWRVHEAKITNIYCQIKCVSLPDTFMRWCSIIWRATFFLSLSFLSHTFCRYVTIAWAGIAQSVLRLATGWTVRGSNPGGGEIFRIRPGRPWDPPSLLNNWYRVSLPGVKRPGIGVNQPLPSSAEVKERVDLCLYFPSGSPADL